MNIHPTIIPGTESPDSMNLDERHRVRQAANKALRIHPDPVGKVLFRELWAWQEFGYRLGDGSLIKDLVDHIHEQDEAAA